MPTASLTDKESEILFDIIGKLKKKGTSVLYVSHRMDEIFRLTDRITVFKNGSMVSCVKTSEVDKDKLVSMMTDEWKGSDIVHNTNFGKVLLEVQGIRTKDGVMKKGSLKVREKRNSGCIWPWRKRTNRTSGRNLWISSNYRRNGYD